MTEAALRAKIAQLEAENEQLKDDQKQLQEQIDAKQVVKVVQSAQKLRKYSGDSTELARWIADCKRQISIQSLTGRTASEYILSHLEGHAEAEVQFALDVTKCTPQDIFTALKTAFSEQLSAADILDQFYSRRQGERESLRDFAYALMKLLDRALAVKSDCVADKDIVLRDRFILKVRNDRLRDHLRTEVWKNPTMKFQQAREEALHFANEDGKSTTKKVVSAVAQSADISTPSPSLGNHPPDASQFEEIQRQLGQLLEIQKNQGEQLQRQQKLINELLSSNSKDKEKPTVTCTFCGKTNHVKKNCFKWKAQMRKEADNARDKNEVSPNPAGKQLQTYQQVAPAPYGYGPPPMFMPMYQQPEFAAPPPGVMGSGQLGPYQQPQPRAAGNTPDLN